MAWPLGQVRFSWIFAPLGRPVSSLLWQLIVRPQDALGSVGRPFLTTPDVHALFPQLHDKSRHRDGQYDG
jgi:hypothetical protein